MTTVLELRPHQRKAKSKLMRAWNQNGRIVLQASTSFGKTELASSVIEDVVKDNKKIMFVVYGKQLVLQTSKRLIKYGIDHGIIMNGYPVNLSKNAQVVSISTLISRWEVDNAPKFDYVIVDETHEIGRYKFIWEAYPEAKILGLSATPDKADLSGLGDYFDEIIFGPPMKWLINNDWLIAPRMFAPECPDVSKIKINKITRDYDATELDQLMADDELVANAYEHWKSLAYGRKTLAFCSGVKHSKAMQERFELAGIPCAHIDGTTPQDDRIKIFEQFDNDEIQIIFNNRVLDRGFDYPKLYCLMDLQPTKDVRLYLQKMGRLMRIAEGKDEAIYLDLCGNFYRHEFPWNHVLWSLDGILEKEAKDKTTPKDIKEKKEMLIACPSCNEIFDAREGKCPHCGFVISQQQAENRFTEIVKSIGEYKEGDDKPKIIPVSQAEKTRWYRELKKFAADHGYNSHWADHTYRKRFDVWPSGLEVNGQKVKKNKLTPAKHISPEVNDFIFYQLEAYKRSQLEKGIDDNQSNESMD